MFALKKEHYPKYTQADWEQWEGKWELIDSIAFAMAPAPGWYHQELNTNIVSELRALLKDCQNCKANMPVNWKISEKTIVEPDVVVVCKPFEEGVYLTKTPEIIFEILSPATAENDLTSKYELYMSQAVKYYIIVRPLEKSAEIFLINAAGQYLSQGRITSEIFHFDISGCSFDLDFSKVW